MPKTTASTRNPGSPATDAGNGSTHQVLLAGGVSTPLSTGTTSHRPNHPNPRIRPLNRPYRASPTTSHPRPAVSVLSSPATAQAGMPTVPPTVVPHASDPATTTAPRNPRLSAFLPQRQACLLKQTHFLSNEGPQCSAPGKPANIPPSPPTSNSSNSVSNTLPGDGTYEVILEAMGTVFEQPPGTIRESGILQVIQGQVGPAYGLGYHAFVSIGNINIPLASSSATRRIGPSTYLINIHNGAFVIELDPRTEPQLVSGLESILGWFTVWERTGRPNGVMNAASPYYPFVSSAPSMDFATAAAVQTPIPVPSVSNSSSVHSMWRAKIEVGGNKGVEFVNRVGDAVNAYIAATGEKMVVNHGNQPVKSVNVGNSTMVALTGIRSMVGAGANVASRVIDTVSNVVERKVATSETVQRMRNAEPESSERHFYELLTSGCIAVGRVVLAADHQGRLIVETAGNNATRIAGVKYGEQAAKATQQGTLIAVNTYRIVRFPGRLGSTSLLRGAMAGSDHVLSNYGLSRPDA